ncbi:MAG: hypothetical protein LZF60_420034 [Nitrospira sp.]|nr:MAG: hypothetical protein LZF60_420034 [Nitrospira sp.]
MVTGVTRTEAGRRSGLWFRSSHVRRRGMTIRMTRPCLTHPDREDHPVLTQVSTHSERARMACLRPSALDGST